MIQEGMLLKIPTMYKNRLDGKNKFSKYVYEQNMNSTKRLASI